MSDSEQNVIFSLTPAQFKYVAECVANGLNCFPPWTYGVSKEAHWDEYANLFNLRKDVYGNYSDYVFDEDDED